MSTVARMLREKLTRDADRAYSKVKENGVWKAGTGRDCEADVLRAAARLQAHGVGPGDRVAILGNPHPRWLVFDFATLCLGGVTVGIYPTLTPDQVAYQLRHSGAKVFLCDEQAQLDRLAEAIKACPELRHAGDFHLPESGVEAGPFWEQALSVKPEDPCALIYTSGTTGDPKGAIITHRAAHAVSLTSQEAVKLEPGDRAVVFLPLAHSLQRMTVYRGLLEQVEAWFCPNLPEFLDVVKEAKPSVLASVPRMLEKIKARIEGEVAKANPRRQAIFRTALACGKARSRLVEAGQAVPFFLDLQWKFWDLLVYKKVRGHFGGELRMFVCGGARLDPEVARFFHAFGVMVMEGWGLTETTAPATVNRLESFRFGTVGKPLPGTEVRVAADGELEVRGPGLFSGYWDNPAATAECMTLDGYYKTGDIGTIDADGFVSITDRKKEIIVTAGGKNIAPVPIEKRLEGGPIGQAVIIGEGRPCLGAVFAPDPEHPQEGRDAFAEARVREVNATLAPYEQVKTWRWLPEPLSVETNTLTPTMKLKRRVINERFATTIGELYAG